MFQGKENKFAWNRIGLIAVLLAVSLVLIVGTAWGRYRTQLSGYITVRSREPAQIYLFGDDSETGYTKLTNHWEVSASGTGSSLSVLITNCEKGGVPPQRDVKFSLRLAATEGIGEADNLKLSLYVNDADGSVAYDAVAQAIAEDTLMYEQFGNGWVYRFYDADGNEVEFTLPGAAVSEWSGVLACDKVNLGDDASLLQLQVIARDN